MDHTWPYLCVFFHWKDSANGLSVGVGPGGLDFWDTPI